MSNVTIGTPTAPLILYDHGPRHGYRPPPATGAKRVLLVQQTAICNEADWRNARITSIQKYVDEVGARLERDHWMLAVRSAHEPDDVDMGPRADICMINDAEDPIDAVYRDYVRNGPSARWELMVGDQGGVLLALKRAFPGIRFGIYARPRVTYYADYQNWRPWSALAPEERDELIKRYVASVLPVVEHSGVLFPSLYDYFKDGHLGQPFNEPNVDLAEAQLSMVEANLDVCRIARSRFNNPDVKILPCVTPWFWSGAYAPGEHFPVPPHEFLEQQVMPAKAGGADGVMVWNGNSWALWAATTYPERYPDVCKKLAAAYFPEVHPESVDWKSPVTWDAMQAKADRILDAALTTCHEIFAPPPPVVVEPAPEPKPETKPDPGPVPEVPTKGPPAAEDPAPPAHGEPITISSESLMRISDGLRSIAHGANAVAQELDQIGAEIGA